MSRTRAPRAALLVVAVFAGLSSSWDLLLAFSPALFWAPVLSLLLLFPDGHLPSRRWLPVGWLSSVWLRGTT
jgi:hypothetical protein